MAEKSEVSQTKAWSMGPSQAKWLQTGHLAILEVVYIYIYVHIKLYIKYIYLYTIYLHIFCYKVLQETYAGCAHQALIC